MTPHPRVPAFVPCAPPPRRPLDLLAVAALLLSLVAVLAVSAVLMPVLLTACAAVCLHRGMCWMLGQ